MKVVCESCQAKYQVPDERVAGKKLKIRCKRCGATVLIRGDLLQGESSFDRSVSSAGSLAAAEPLSREIVGYEWHVSLDGDTRGPFSLEELRTWLNATPGGWDAHVWHEGFQDWMDARACAELEPPALPAAFALGNGASMQDDDLPPETLPVQVGAGAQFLAEVSGGAHGAHAVQAQADTHGFQSQFRRTTGQSALRARAPSGFGESGGARASSPNLSSATRLGNGAGVGNDRQEDAGLFSNPSLHTMSGNAPASSPAAASTPSYVHGPNPGFASGEGSGLIDIRALASLARQSTAQLNPGASAAAKAAEARTTAASAFNKGDAPPAPEGGFSFGSEDYARPGTAGLSSAYARVDSLAPVTHAQTSNAALPLAIVGGCALVAAAVLAAVLFTRSSRDAEMAASQAQESPSAAAQPSGDRESSAQAATDTDLERDRGEREANAPEAKAGPTGPAANGPEGDERGRAEEDEDDELAAGKAKRQPRAPHTAVEEKKNATPDEKAKPKKEEKPEAQESGEVMLADRAKPVKPPVEAEPAPANPANANAVNAAAPRGSSSDIDELLSAKHAAKPAAAKPGSVDELLNSMEKGEKPAPAPAAKAPAPVPAASDTAAPASDLPELPSRDETLAAMRGVEAAVRGCGTNEQPIAGTAEVAVVVTGATGRVTSATVTGITGNVGSCIARAVRAARFPRFSKPTFSIKYPYRF